MMKGRLFLLAWLLTTAAQAQPATQPLRFSRLTAKHGLSHNYVTSILQDHEGFLWIGTRSGLNRYDGRTFTIYRNVSADTTSLSNSLACGLLEDRAGRLWVGTIGGVNRFDRATGKFVRYALDLGLRAAEVRSCRLLEDQNGILWLGTSLGLFYYSSKSV